jgi:hypothetical protein
MSAKHIVADVVIAKSFVLVDGEERERARITSGSGEAVTVHLIDHLGHPRIALQVDDDGNPSICLWTENDAPAVSLSVNRDRGNGITVGDAIGIPCVDIAVPNTQSEVPPRDAPHIVVRDRHGQQLWSSKDPH